jgi:hypothetical protein
VVVRLGAQSAFASRFAAWEAPAGPGGGGRRYRPLRECEGALPRRGGDGVGSPARAPGEVSQWWW